MPPKPWLAAPSVDGNSTFGLWAILLVVVLDGSFSMMLRNKLHVGGRDRKMLFGWVAQVLEIMLGAE